MNTFIKYFNIFWLKTHFLRKISKIEHILEILSFSDTVLQIKNFNFYWASQQIPENLLILANPHAVQEEPTGKVLQTC